MEKTNVSRLLDINGIEYSMREYDPEVTDGQEVAKLIGKDPETVFKTLVTVVGVKDYRVFVIPVSSTLDLKKAAKAAGDKDMAMVPVKELLHLTGYIRGGCSPVGMKKKYPTYFEETCQLYDEIAVSAGERGHQMILSPLLLAKLVNATFTDLIV